MADVVSKAVADAALADLMYTRSHRERHARLDSRRVGTESGLRRKGHGWRRSERDEQVLQFATLHGMILLRQAAKWFYGGQEKTAYKRMMKMEQAGLINRDAGVAEWAGTVITPTVIGQKVGLEGLPPMFASLANRALSVPDNLLHAALVADRILVKQSEGFTVFTERQIRLMDKADEDEVTAFLESQGVHFSSTQTEPGVRAGTVFRERRDGADQLQVLRSQTFLAAPVPAPGQPTDTPEPHSVRFPDFVFVTHKTGELVAMEVEIATKATDRLAAIVTGYSKAVSRLIPDGRTRSSYEMGADGRPVMARHQFRQVQWWCVPETARMLRTTKDPRSGRERVGYIAAAMPFEYQQEDRPVKWHAQQSSLPMTVHDVTADDEGVQYRLDQRVLSPYFRCSYKRWRVWRQLWLESTTPAERALATFCRWVPGNHEKCLHAEQQLANAAPPMQR